MKECGAQVDIAGGDAVDRERPEPPDNVVPEVTAVGFQRARPPEAGVSPKHLYSDQLDPENRQCGCNLVSAFAGCSKQGPGIGAGLLDAEGLGLSDELPVVPASMLAVDAVAPGPRRQDLHCAALAFAVLDIVGRRTGLARVDAAPV